MVRVPGLRTAAVAVVGGCAIAALAAGASARSLISNHGAASGTVVFANTSSVQKLDPDVVTNFVDFQALRLIYDTLVTYNDKLQLTPGLATSWSFSNGGKTITFQLRKNVNFTDGTTFTSANVVASLNRVKDPKTADAASSFISSVTKIVPDGTYAVKLLLSHPDASVLNGLTSLNLAMLSTKSITAGTLSKTPIGTGPYQFASWAPNNSFTVNANPGWWGGKVTVPQVQIKTIPNEQSIASALQAGTVQIGLMTQPQITEHLPSSITVQKVLDLSYRALMLQDRTGPLANLYNRLAMACALDRQAVLTSSVLGQGKAIGPVPLGPYASKPISAVCPTPDISQGQVVSRKGREPGRLLVHRDDVDRPRCHLERAGDRGAVAAQAGRDHDEHPEPRRQRVHPELAEGQVRGGLRRERRQPEPVRHVRAVLRAGREPRRPVGLQQPALQKIVLAIDAASDAGGDHEGERGALQLPDRERGLALAVRQLRLRRLAPGVKGSAAADGPTRAAGDEVHLRPR